MTNRYKITGANEMEGVDAFMFVWDHSIDSDEYHRKVVAAPDDMRISSSGNINNIGSNFSSKARSITRQNVAFMQYVEGGVRELVSILVEKHNLITYSSCEGHVYSQKHTGDQREVGILPRDKKEYDKVLAALDLASVKVNKNMDTTLVELALYLGWLNDNGKEYAVIDLVFRKVKDVSWISYFDEIEKNYPILVHVLENIDPISNASVSKLAL